MAQLFKKNVIKDKLQNYVIPDFEEKIKIIESWNNLYLSGNLQNKKEEELEAPFGDDFFGKILGYDSLTQNDLYNRKFQPKVLIGGQKADLGLGFFSNSDDIMKVIVELKDAKTSLDKPQQRAGNLTPVQQAFKYKPYFKEVDFIIVSNFFETRLYIDNYYDYESFTLSDLANSSDNYFNFRKFYYLLNRDNLISKKNESNTKSLLSLIRIQEKEITKQFYREYTILRKELFKDIVASNQGFKKTELDFLLNKTQKIIDRIIFIHFCEDLGLLPQGKLKENILRAEELDFTPWEVLKKFFKGVDSGSEKLGIPDGYNGGLFHDDLELNNLKVGNEICKKFVDLGEYDFADELSVNILGHIFEQSISDIEELKDKINKQEEATLSKRKKDGVFYTPEYIVDYIVKNSVGKKIDEWEEELKEKHNLKDDITDKNYSKRAILVYSELQEKVKNIKVLDPACGSGAFLVKVFDFLLDKNKEISKKLEDLGLNQGLFSSESYFKSILQNNIYGVDLNEESVEITKLSLWLKTAQKGRKLANLDKNIKCGNSLIDDKEIAGDKAFVWEEEFSEIFRNGGFDVIVGNPPYVRIQNLGENYRKYFEKEYFTAYKGYDLYVLFVEKISKILKESGYCSFIMPKKFINTDYGNKLKEFIYNNRFLNTFIDFGFNQIFEDATTYTGIFIFSKNNKESFKYKFLDVGFEDLIFLDFDLQNYNNISSNDWILVSKKEKNLFDKLNDNSKLEDYIDGLFQGLVTGVDAIFILEETPDGLFSKETGKLYNFNSDIIFDLLKGSEILRYSLSNIQYKIIFPYKMEDGKTSLISESDMQNKYSDIYDYLKESEKKLRNRENGKFNNNSWYQYSRNQNISKMPGRKILTQVLSKYSSLTIDESGTKYFVGGGTAGGYGITLKDNINLDLKYILILLNSILLNWFIKKYSSPFSGGYYAYNKTTMSKLPIKIIPLSEQQPFIEKADFMLEKNKILQEKTNKFLNRLKTSFGIEKFSKKIVNFYDLDFADFINELKKNKISLSLKDQDEWEEYFLSYKNEILELKSEIDKCDKEIDEMVFDLYGLDEEERRVVLGNN